MDALLSFQDQAGTPYWPESGITHLEAHADRRGYDAAMTEALEPVVLQRELWRGRAQGHLQHSEAFLEGACPIVGSYGSKDRANRLTCDWPDGDP
jgi:hypothetical protein